MRIKQLLLATNNEGKIKEYREIFKQLGLKIQTVSLKDVGITEKVEEDGKTFKENAIKKARFYRKLTGLPTLADDGGLEIDYLRGEPGVKSRRWPGYEATDKELIALTLKKLKDVPKRKRGAQFRVVIALVIPGDKTVYTFHGFLRGFIAEKRIRKLISGYPFRAIFIPSRKKKLGLVAHRKMAVEKALPIIKKFIILDS